MGYKYMYPAQPDTVSGQAGYMSPAMLNTISSLARYHLQPGWIPSPARLDTISSQAGYHLQPGRIPSPAGPDTIKSRAKDMPLALPDTIFGIQPGWRHVFGPARDMYLARPEMVFGPAGESIWPSWIHVSRPNELSYCTGTL